MVKEKETKIEQTIKVLSELEGNLEETETKLSKMKVDLIALAKKEGEKSKIETRTLTTKIVEKKFQIAKTTSEKEAKKVMEKNKKDLKRLKDGIDTHFEEAVKIVIKAASEE